MLLVRNQSLRKKLLASLPRWWARGAARAGSARTPSVRSHSTAKTRRHQQELHPHRENESRIDEHNINTIEECG